MGEWGHWYCPDPHFTIREIEGERGKCFSVPHEMASRKNANSEKENKVPKKKVCRDRVTRRITSGVYLRDYVMSEKF